MEAAIAAVDRVPEISREQCRKVFEERFSARRMARDYVQVYEKVAAQASGRLPRK
jgi:glycosyltransferase involved in cell wall biosynthesis